MCGDKGIPGSLGYEIQYWPEWLKNIHRFIWESPKLYKVSGEEKILNDLDKLIKFWENNKYTNPFKEKEQ